MSLFKGIVKLTEEQYLILKDSGTLETDLGTFVFDENILYVTETDYTKTQIKIVDFLPTIGETNTIYMVLQSGSSNVYDRYMYINDRFTIIGDTTIDLTNYVKKSELPTSLPASDVYEWAKKPEKPSYTIDELPGELLNSNKAEVGSNTTTTRLGFSVVRNVSNVIHQALVSIYDDGSIRISHRNKSANANLDDSYIEFGPSKLKYGANDILTSSNGYKKEEIDAMIKELKSLINGQ